MVKSKRSLYNAVMALTLTLLNGLLGFIVTKLILENYGSDFNGINSTATQIATMLMVLEGGFTVATNVALFKPCRDGSIDIINSIVVATNNQFKKMGKIFIFLGIVVAFIYSVFVSSGVSQFDIFLIIVMAIIPSGVNLYYATKYRILIQSEQKEYIISFIMILTVSSSHIINIFVAYNGLPVITIRLVTMLFALTQSILIAKYAKNKYKYIDLSVKPNYGLIKGTKDILMQKITGVVYSTFPIIFISLSSTSNGTLLASVYAVYNSVFSLIKVSLQSIMDAPRLSFGQLITERDRKYVYEKFFQYELIVIVLLTIIIACCGSLILPFIKLYASNISDINYLDPIVAILFIVITFFEIAHIPSGHLLNMSGNFRVSRNIQIVASVCLIGGMFLGNYFLSGLYGILVAVALTAIILFILETFYMHTKYFNEYKKFIFLIIYNIILIILLVTIETHFISNITNYLSFFLTAIVILIINFICVLFINTIFNFSSIKSIYRTVKAIFKRR